MTTRVVDQIADLLPKIGALGAIAARLTGIAEGFTVLRPDSVYGGSLGGGSGGSKAADLPRQNSEDPRGRGTS